MRTTTLGRGGLRIPRVGLGCGQLGGRVCGSAAAAVLAAALDTGVTLFDTADVYADGDSERTLGRAIAGRRDEVVLATKFRHGPGPRGAGRKSIRVAVEASLSRLGTDYLDLYQVHAPDPVTPVEETVAALVDLVRQGKILYFGVCNVSAWQAVDLHHVARAGGGVLTSVQAQLNLVDRDRLADLRPAAGQFGFGLLAASPLGRGLLGGAYRPDRPPPSGHPLAGPKGTGYWSPAGHSTVDRVRQVAADRGLSPAQTALSALLTVPEVSAVLVGASTPEQVAELGKVDPRLLDEADARYLFGQAERR